MLLTCLAPILVVHLTTPARAQPTADPAEMADKLHEHLGVSLENAERIAAILKVAHEDAASLRERAMEQAKALKAAKDQGDEKGMKRAMAELERVARAHTELKQDAKGDIFDRLTVEQRAMWTLFHLHKHAQNKQRLRQARTMELFEAL